ncbi:hypothetical protein [Nostoc sp.]|uniref:hypothetical protein n=1 Tax=Nostoc sp. TaxID=1180 RepID=UPI002FF81B18
MRSFQFITPRGDGKIERSCQCDIFDGLRLRIRYFTTGDRTPILSPSNGTISLGFSLRGLFN